MPLVSIYYLNEVGCPLEPITSHTGTASGAATEFVVSWYVLGRRARFSLALIGVLLLQSGLAAAADHLGTDAELAQQVSDGVAAVSVAADQSLTKFQRIDALGEKGLTTQQYLPPSMSMLGDLGGWRSSLAEFDMSLQTGLGLNVVSQINDTGQPRDPQRYNGQRTTVSNVALGGALTAGLGRWGLPSSSVTLGAMASGTSFEEINGPRVARIQTLSYYQSFADKLVELKVGWFRNVFEYVGLTTGGVSYMSSGFASSVPIQAGLSASVSATPAVNVTINGHDGGYFKFGAQRSLSPQGLNYEAAHSGTGLRVSQKGASALYIGELGLRRDAAANQRQTWLRSGYLYNTSDYTDLRDGGTTKNWTGYMAGDYQAVALPGAHPSRGVYIGASGFVSPARANVFERNYEARIYGTGLALSRPLDTVALRVGYTQFSEDARRVLEDTGEKINNHELNFTASYSGYVARGLFVIPALAYTVNPSVVGDYNDAIVGSLTLFMGF